MNATQSGAENAAHLWAIRLSDPSFDDWDGFATWLEQDPANLAAYEAALEADNWATSLLADAAARAVNDDMPIITDESRLARGAYWATGLATVAAAVIALVLFWPSISGRGIDWIATAPRQHRTVALEDGTRIVMNGGTKIGLSKDGSAREVTLAQGEALFYVRHDSAHAFSVIVGDTRLVDAGTVFNVVRDGTSLHVAVAEGEVVYQPGAGQISLRSGDLLSRINSAAMPIVSHVDPQIIGDWQTDALQYSNATLDQIALDLGRNLGRPVAAGPDVAAMRFTGTLSLAGTPPEVLARAAPLLGVTFTPGGEGWTMHRDDDAHR